MMRPLPAQLDLQIGQAPGGLGLVSAGQGAQPRQQAGQRGGRSKFIVHVGAHAQPPQQQCQAQHRQRHGGSTPQQQTRQVGGQIGVGRGGARHAGH